MGYQLQLIAQSVGFFCATHTENPSFFFHTDPAHLRWEIGWGKASAKVALRIEILEPLDERSDLGLIADRQRLIEPVMEKARPDFSMDDPGASRWSRMRVEAGLERPDPADRLQERIVSETTDDRNPDEALSTHTSLPHQLPSGLHSPGLAVHPAEPLKGKVRGHVMRIALGRARAAQIRPVCVARTAPKRAGERTATTVEFRSDGEPIIVISFVIAQQPGHFFPNPFPERSLARETKSPGEASGIAVGKIKAHKHASVQLHVVDQPIAHKGSTGMSCWPVPLSDERGILQARCQGFSHPDGIVLGMLCRRRIPGTPIHHEIAFKET